MTLHENHSVQPKRKKALRVVVIFLVVVCIAGIAGRLWYQHKFPYGWSHCCIAGIGIKLRSYADEHDGWLPHGKSTPEASLSLLCEETNLVEWVRGKNIPRAVAEAAMAKDGVLGPESCGWHYVEGLRVDDDLQIAVVWDKIRGLGHNGERRPGMARSVVLLDGSQRGIIDKLWPEFVVDQKERLAKVIASRQSNAPPIRWSDKESLGPNISPLGGY